MQFMITITPIHPLKNAIWRMMVNILFLNGTCTFTYCDIDSSSINSHFLGILCLNEFDYIECYMNHVSESFLTGIVVTRSEVLTSDTNSVILLPFMLIGIMIVKEIQGIKNDKPLKVVFNFRIRSYFFSIQCTS